MSLLCIYKSRVLVGKKVASFLDELRLAQGPFKSWSGANQLLPYFSRVAHSHFQSAESNTPINFSNDMSVCPRCLSGVFPEADKDPVIQIANMVVRQGEQTPFIRNVYTLNTCAPIIGCQVLAYQTEDELLKVRFDWLPDSNLLEGRRVGIIQPVL